MTVEMSSGQLHSSQQTNLLDRQRDDFRISFSASSLKCWRIVLKQLWLFTIQTVLRATLMPFTSHDADWTHNAVLWRAAHFWHKLLKCLTWNWKWCRVLPLFFSFEMEQRTKRQHITNSTPTTLHTHRNTHSAGVSRAVWAAIFEVIVEKDGGILWPFTGNPAGAAPHQSPSCDPAENLHEKVSLAFDDNCEKFQIQTAQSWRRKTKYCVNI